jgi:integrase
MSTTTNTANIVYGPWKIKRENQKGISRFTVVRYVKFNGHESTQRLSVRKYKAIRDNPEELQKLCDRLNYDYNKEKLAREKVQWKHAFINDALIEEFRELLANQIPSKDKVSTNIYYLKHYFLNFFIQELGLANPKEWYQVHATKWATFLQGSKVPAAASTKRDIIQIANRFLKWLHGKRPDEVPLLILEPLSKSVLKKIDADRKMNGEDADRKHVPDDDWKIIKEKLPATLKWFALLAYNYGLRRGEVLGLAPTHVRNSHLLVERQLIKLRPEPTYGPPKNRETRKVPHWNCKPADAHKWITESASHLCHTDTLSDRWLEFMEKLKAAGHITDTYDFHDLRHSFLTKAMSTQSIPKMVMLAAGHKDLKTTTRYSHDDRNLDDDVFDPSKPTLIKKPKKKKAAKDEPEAA